MLALALALPESALCLSALQRICRRLAMDNCPICLENLDAASPVLPCGHRCHASCLGQLADATGSAPTRRGRVIACPSCRQESRVAAQTPVATFGVGDEVYALWGHRWYPGIVDEVRQDGYEIAWDGEDASNEVPAARVRARVQPVPAPTAVATPRNTPEPQAAPARPQLRPLAPPAVSPPVLNEDSDDDGIEAEEQRVAALEQQLEDAKRTLQEKQDRKKRKRESEPAAESPAAETCIKMDTITTIANNTSPLLLLPAHAAAKRGSNANVVSYKSVQIGTGRLAVATIRSANGLQRLMTFRPPAWTRATSVKRHGLETNRVRHNDASFVQEGKDFGWFRTVWTCDTTLPSGVDYAWFANSEALRLVLWTTFYKCERQIEACAKGWAPDTASQRRQEIAFLTAHLGCSNRNGSCEKLDRCLKEAKS